MVAIIAVITISCGVDDLTGFTYGESMALDVDGLEQIEDPVSGLTFGFPEGGIGVLTVTEIMSAPERPFEGGRGFHVEYDGAYEFMVRGPVGEDEYPLCIAILDQLGETRRQ